MKIWQKILFASLLVTGVAINAQAGVINYNLSDVKDKTRSDSIIPWFSTGIITEEVKSFTLNFDWKDQGWGNFKGRIYYNSGDSGWLDLGLLAKHHWKDISKTIVSSSYSDFDVAPLNFGYVVGGGGGHKLYIEDATLSITTVSEPLTIALFGLGIVGLGFSRRRAKSKVAVNV